MPLASGSRPSSYERLIAAAPPGPRVPRMPGPVPQYERNGAFNYYAFCRCRTPSARQRFCSEALRSYISMRCRCRDCDTALTFSHLSLISCHLSLCPRGRDMDLPVDGPVDTRAFSRPRCARLLPPQVHSPSPPGARAHSRMHQGLEATSRCNVAQASFAGFHSA